MKNVLVGAVESTRVALEAMTGAGAPPVLLVTLPPEKSARHSDYVDLAPLASDHGVPVLHAPAVNAPDVLDAIRRARPEHLFVIGWSQICGPDLLNAPTRGAIGYHPAPLPEFRGRAVIPWTILQGRTRTASTLFWMDEGMDSGDVLAQEHFPVAADETAATLMAKHLEALARMLRSVLPALSRGDAPREAQDHARATYCARRTAADGLIDWSEPAERVWTLIRAAGDPYPGAYSYYRGEKLVVRAAELVGPGPYIGLPGQVQAVGDEGVLVRCGDGGHVRLRVVQVPGSEPVAAHELIRNHTKLGMSICDMVDRLAQGVVR